MERSERLTQNVTRQKLQVGYRLAWKKSQNQMKSRAGQFFRNAGKSESEKSKRASQDELPGSIAKVQFMPQ